MPFRAEFARDKGSQIVFVPSEYKNSESWYAGDWPLSVSIKDLTRHYILLIQAMYTYLPKLITLYSTSYETDKLNCQHIPHLTRHYIDLTQACMPSCQIWPHRIVPYMQLTTSNANTDEALEGSKCWSEFVHKLSTDIPTWKDLDRLHHQTWSGSVESYDALWGCQVSQYLIS